MHGHKIIKSVAGVVIVAVLLAVALVVHTFHGGNLQKARQIATRLQASAMANPNPVTARPSASGAGASTASRPSGSPAANAGAPAAEAKAAAPDTTAPSAQATSAAVSPAAATPAKPGVPTTPTTAATLAAPRRQPTTAEVNLAIGAVHDLLQFFTPTAEQIASVGDQVCTLLDRDTPFSQIESQALDMVGAGSISWMIPSTVPDIAIHTVVALYCLTNASKLK